MVTTDQHGCVCADNRLTKVPMQVPVGTARIICPPTCYQYSSMQEVSTMPNLPGGFALLTCILRSPVRRAYFKHASSYETHHSSRDLLNESSTSNLQVIRHADVALE